MEVSECARKLKAELRSSGAVTRNAEDILGEIADKIERLSPAAKKLLRSSMLARIGVGDDEERTGGLF